MHLNYLEKGDPKICEEILRALPNWFGIEESTLAYIKKSPELPMLIAYDGETATGFIQLLNHNKFTSEIYVMGVKKEYHRKGIGSALIKEAENFLKRKGFEYLQVKTVSDERVCDFYKETRKFYRAYGFRDVEVFPTLWDSFNPCLLLIKSIR